MALTLALIAPVQSVCTEFTVVTKQSQMHPNTTKRNKTLVQGPMGWIGCVLYKNFRSDLVARTFALLAPV